MMELVESKEAKFKRVAEYRVAQVIHYLGLLEHTAGSGYTSTEEQQTQMLEAMTDGLTRVRNAFNADQRKFRFKD